MRLKSLKELGRYRYLFDFGEKQDQVNVVVMPHAIDRIRDPMRCPDAGHLSQQAAEKTLTRIACNGNVVGRRPGGAVEMDYDGMYAVVKPEMNKLIVLTFNGDRVWRNWFRREHSMLRRTGKALAAL